MNGIWRGVLGMVLVGALGVMLSPVTLIGFTDTVRIPIVKEHPASDPPEPAQFSHWTHGEARCYACHPAVFPKGKKGFLHKDMEKGLYCGSCHNGVQAWDVDDDDIECEACHVPYPGATDEIEDFDSLFEE